MTRLTKTPSAVTLTGTAELITLPCAYLWVWVRNDGDKTVYISQTSDVGEGVAGTMAVPAGGRGRLALTGQSFYALGTGVMQVDAANYASCSFKSAPAVSGGGSGITMYEIATITLAAVSSTTSSYSKSITVDLPAGTIVYVALYNPSVKSYNTGYYKMADIWLRIFDVADGKNSRTQVYGTGTNTVALRYTPSTQQLYISASGMSIPWVAKIYRAEGVTFDTD